MIEIEEVSEVLSFSTALLWLITKILADFSVFSQHRKKVKVNFTQEQTTKA